MEAMGRPPIGKRAMSSAERQRRYWERVLQGGARSDDAALRAELAAAKARIAELGAENAALKAKIAKAQGKPPPFPHPRTAADWESLKAAATAERKAKRAQAKAARLAAAVAERPEADVPTLLAENESLKQQLKATRTQIRHLRSEVSYITNARGAAFTPALEKQIRICLHPDWVTDSKQKRRYEKTLADFNAVMDAIKAK
jgi:cell division protein FtsB